MEIWLSELAFIFNHAAIQVLLPWFIKFGPSGKYLQHILINRSEIAHAIINFVRLNNLVVDLFIVSDMILLIGLFQRIALNAKVFFVLSVIRKALLEWTIVELTLYLIVVYLCNLAIDQASASVTWGFIKKHLLELIPLVCGYHFRFLVFRVCFPVGVLAVVLGWDHWPRLVICGSLRYIRWALVVVVLSQCKWRETACDEKQIQIFHLSINLL